MRVLARQDGDWALFPEPLPVGLDVEILPPDIDLRVPARTVAMARGALRSVARAPAATASLYRACRTDPMTADEPFRNLVRHLPFSRRRHADVIHFEFLGTGAMYPLVKAITGVPYVVSCRGSDIHQFELRGKEMQAGMLRCLREAAAIHCVSNEIAGHVERLVGPRPGIWINRPAVDVRQIAPRQWHDRANGPLRIISVGRLSWHKAFDYLMAALARLDRRGIAFEATILGDGELLAPLRFSVADLGLEAKVKLPGAVRPDEVLDQLRRADVFVLPSHNEGVSNAALEAMACALPVVSTRVGGMPEAIDDGVEGLLVRPRDIQGLADALERLAGDGALRAAMGTAARARIESEFSLERQVSTFEQMYQSVARSSS